MLKMQITLFDKENKYKPLTTLIDVKDLEDYKNNKQYYNKKAIQNISVKRYLTPSELKKLGFTLLKAREYTPERIEKDKKKNQLKFLYKQFKEKQQQTNTIE